MNAKSFLSISKILSFILILVFYTGCEKEDPITPEESGPAEVINASTGLKSTVANGTFYIINKNSGKALDLYTNTGNILQYSYWGGSNQQWILTDVGSGYYKISPVYDPSLAIDIAGQSTADGANVQTWSYWGGTNQQFQFIDAGSGYYRIVARNSGKALDVEGSSTSNGANVLQWSYWGGANQQWMLHSISNGSANGQLSWILTTTNIPQDVKDRITVAMNAAVARYNYWGSWSPRTLTVEYNTGVPTADGNINGNIRFGSNTSYQTECTAMHEIAHTYGVGTSSNWGYPLIQNYLFVGTNAVTKIHEFDGSGAVINTGGGHFWPYGLNYNTEWSTNNGDRHAQIVWAMVQDGLY